MSLCLLVVVTPTLASRQPASTETGFTFYELQVIQLEGNTNWPASGICSRHNFPGVLYLSPINQSPHLHSNATIVVSASVVHACRIHRAT